MVHHGFLAISALGVVVVTSVVTEGSLFAAGYKLALSEEPAMCGQMLELSNRGLLKTESLEASGSRPSSKEVSFIEWKELGNLSEDLAYERGLLHSAIFDIDNDGQKDWVVKEDTFLSSQISESLLIFRRRNEPLSKDDGLNSEDLRKSDGSINFTGQSYYLKKLPPYKFKDGQSALHGIGGGFKLVPFRFRDISYLLIANPFQEQFLGGRRFAAIAQYSLNGELKDICYIEKIGN